jgi:uncharacterized protein (TIGR02118 family)
MKNGSGRESIMAAQIVVPYNTPADVGAFDRYYAETHTPLVKKIPGLRSLTVSTGPVVTQQGPSPYHLVATLAFDSMEALQAALDSPEGQAAGGDLRNFAQAGATILMYETREA